MADAPEPVFALVAAGILATVHVFGGKLRFLETTPRSRWLSAAGGASVAYVFMHLLPELARAQHTLLEISIVRLLETHAYFIALLGLVLFYGLERLVKRSPRQRRPDSRTGPSLFWVHLSSFAAYNALVGYLLTRRDAGGGLLLYAAAMALHFLVNDFGLRHDHKSSYHDTGRWLLSAAVLGGAVAGTLVSLPEATVDALFAFLAGGIVLNVLKEELPEQRESRFGAFALGAGAYAALLIAAS